MADWWWDRWRERGRYYLGKAAKKIRRSEKEELARKNLKEKIKLNKHGKHSSLIIVGIRGLNIQKGECEVSSNSYVMYVIWVYVVLFFR